MEADAFGEGVRSIAEAAHVPRAEFEPLVLEGFKDLVERALDDHILSAEEEQRIVQLRDVFGLSAEQFQSAGLQQRLVKGAILRDLQERNPKSRIEISGLPFVLQKSEEPIWVFQDVDYYMMKERTQYSRPFRGYFCPRGKGSLFEDRWL